MIQVSELHFSTEDGVKVLEDIHLRVDQGELMVILGPAASGKSLLLGLLGAQITPQRGQILVHGRNVGRLGADKMLSLRRRIGVVPQGFMPLPRTVRDNIVFKLRALGNYREQAEEKVLYALETTGLIRKQGSEARELSSIDRVRLGISLAICHDPLLLLIDEPFEGLSEDEKAEVARLLCRMNTGHLSILVATRGPVPTGLEMSRRVRLVDGMVKGA
ncbi:ATP-binding cassette domain-containing protein [Candidatus Bipolaricaulota bacterium]|nr:ATP-binding cassette domain-containing protein [Candidatus Bipolaricaulota bacterium]